MEGETYVSMQHYNTTRRHNQFNKKMPINTEDLVEVACIIAEEKNIRVTVKESVKGGIIACISTITGGIVLGPVGLAIGGTIGGCLAAYLAQGKFVCAAEIIRCMKHEDKQKLRDAISKTVANLEIEDAAKLAALVAGDLVLREKVLDALLLYLRTEMQMEILD